MPKKGQNGIKVDNKAKRADDKRLMKPVSVLKVVDVGGVKIRVPAYFEREMDLAPGDELKVSYENKTLTLKHAVADAEERKRLRTNYQRRLQARKVDRKAAKKTKKTAPKAAA